MFGEHLWYLYPSKILSVGHEVEMLVQYPPEFKTMTTPGNNFGCHQKTRLGIPLNKPHLLFAAHPYTYQVTFHTE